MTVTELARLLDDHRDAALRFQLPSGERIPDHFHITEVGRSERDFIDCGGTRRKSVTCLLQAWVAHDLQHRLSADKLAKILKIAEPVLQSNDVPVEFEYGADVASLYALGEATASPAALTITLIGKQTACLALDKCGVGECSTTECCK